MLLRASGEQTDAEAALNSVTDAGVDPGIAHGDTLRALTEATIRNEWLELGDIRATAERSMGAQAVTDVFVVAAAFNGITRVADSTGIPLDANTEQVTQGLRETTGIANFAYAEKTARYG